MASLKDIRTRIASIASNQKITRAMKLVSTAKFTPALQAFQGFSAYAQAYEQMLQALLKHVAFVEQAKGIQIEHTLLRSHHESEPKPRALFLMSSDRGMCGSFNSNLVRALLAYIKSPGTAPDGTPLKRLVKPQCYPLGLYIGKACLREKLNVVEDFGAISQAYSTHSEDGLQKICETLIKAYTDGQCDAVDIFSNNFRSALSQQPLATRLLPIERETADEGELGSLDLICEPELQALLADLLPKVVQVRLKRAVLSSVVGEHAARMNAMSSATDNAQSMIEELTLQMNHARQAAITTELVEIISGAEALK